MVLMCSLYNNIVTVASLFCIEHLIVCTQFVYLCSGSHWLEVFDSLSIYLYEGWSTPKYSINLFIYSFPIKNKIIRKRVIRCQRLVWAHDGT